ncbi:MAG: hypothetical protein PHE77_02585 [Candidatus Pacebacteria bacterium]|nr:hypothetical protein [Candidatus Paceibacterota bacterium]
MGKFKKIVFPGATLLFSFWFSAVFALGIIIGYITTHFGHKKITKDGKFNSVFINFGKWKFHFHHWLMAALAITSCWATGVLETLPKIIVGIAGGMVFHGLYLYDNWHKIIMKKE